jgi:hypothetical protein
MVSLVTVSHGSPNGVNREEWITQPFHLAFQMGDLSYFCHYEEARNLLI